MTELSADFQLQLDAARAELGVLPPEEGERLELTIEQPGESLELAIFDWAPGDHPRDLLGQFKAVLAGLKSGSSAKLPDGTTVRKTDNTRFTVDSGGVATDLHDAASAADVALHESKSSKYVSKTVEVYKKISPTLDKLDNVRQKVKKVTGGIRDVGMSDASIGRRKKARMLDAIWSAGFTGIGGDKKAAVSGLVDSFIAAEQEAQKTKFKREIASLLLQAAGRGFNRLAASQDDMADLTLDVLPPESDDLDDDWESEDDFDPDEFDLALARERAKLNLAYAQPPGDKPENKSDKKDGGKPERPPNLRTFAGDPAHSCGACKHFTPGKCSLYDYPVAADQVSDSFAPRE